MHPVAALAIIAAVLLVVILVLSGIPLAWGIVVILAVALVATVLLFAILADNWFRF